MYVHRDHLPLSSRFSTVEDSDLLMMSGIDGVLGESWEDENGAIVATGFFTYLIGKPSPGEEADRILRSLYPCCLVPKSPQWLDFLSRFRFKTYTRYKMSPPAQTDPRRLNSFAEALPAGLAIRPIDRALLESGVVTDRALNISHAFGTRENYLINGFGFAVLDGNRAVSVVSSYIVYRGEAEVDISTDEAYRGRGLASAVCARFMLECAARQLTPSWDAQNTASMRLAEKLGFTLERAYDAYVLER